jgi:hypothetical protein
MAQAGNWHQGNNLICSDCHTMHATVTHNGGGQWETGTWTPSKYLLKGGVNETCLTCHDGNSYPDVLAQDGGYGLSDRSAGALNANTNVTGKDTAGSGWEYTMGHTLGSTDTAPGEAGSFVPDATKGLGCVDCHQPHGYSGDGTGTPVVDVFGNDLSLGNGTYRNLIWDEHRGGTGFVSVSYDLGGTLAARDTTRDVWEETQSYEQEDVHLNEPVNTNSGFGTWCSDCHKNFHGAVGGPEIGGNVTTGEFIRHPQAGVDIGGIGGGHSSRSTFEAKLYRVRVMTNDTTVGWGPYGTAYTAPTDVTPTCLTCHKAHGNKRPFGLIFANGQTGGTPLGEDGDGSYRTLCKQCHVQGG